MHPVSQKPAPFKDHRIIMVRMAMADKDQHLLVRREVPRGQHAAGHAAPAGIHVIHVIVKDQKMLAELHGKAAII